MGFCVLHVICVQNTLGFFSQFYFIKMLQKHYYHVFPPPPKEPRKLCLLQNFKDLLHYSQT